MISLAQNSVGGRSGVALVVLPLAIANVETQAHLFDASFGVEQERQTIQLSAQNLLFNSN
jgi:hypothetical protein